MDIIGEISKVIHIEVRYKFDSFYDVRPYDGHFKGQLVCFLNSDLKEYQMFNYNEEVQNILNKYGYKETNKDFLDIIVKQFLHEHRFHDSFPVVTELVDKPKEEIQNKQRRKVFILKEAKENV